MTVFSKSLIALLLITAAASYYAQDSKEAENYFATGNFEAALEEYLLLVEEEPDNIGYNYNLAVSYLNTNIDKSKAIPYLEKLSKIDKITPDVHYLLGRAYHFGYRFDDAIKAYLKFLSIGKGNIYNLDNTPTQIAYCQNAKELMKYPVSVTFENLGKSVNSLYADYYPFIPVNENFVIFNSDREDRNAEILENGKYPANIYLSRVVNGKFTDAEKLPEAVNTPEGKQEVVGLNADGSKAIFYFEDYKKFGDLYLSGIEENVVKSPEKLPEVVNSKDVEIAACISADNEKLFFASDRDGGYGGIDLYLCQRLPNGQWSEAQNLGPNINTESDEDFPNLSPDGKTLYFSSKGHAGMGGYDIYRTTWDSIKRKYTNVQNVGYPINTPEDNMNLRISESGKYGYISAVRSGGYGDLDIYRVDFNDVDSRLTVISGVVMGADHKKLENVSIQVIDANTGEEFGDYLPNEKSSRYVIILPPGNFELYIDSDGYKSVYEEIQIVDKSSFKPFIKKDYYLEK